MNNPKLRMLDIRPVRANGQDSFWLRDPFDLAEGHVIVPRPLMPLIVLADGTRELSMLRAELAVRYGVTLPEEQLAGMFETLDSAYLLENERSQAALDAALEAYRQAPHRTPSCAGNSYPPDATELAALLDGWLAEAEIETVPDARGILSPHIDYQRGGPVYARVWKAAAQAAQAAELVVILGTDHYGAPGQVTLTRQSYATPYGALPTAVTLVDALASRLGSREGVEHAYAEELHHIREHAIELSAVWLHHMRERQPVTVLPILLGSPAGYMADKREPDSDWRIAELIAFLGELAQRDNVLFVASADMAHVGPAFGGESIESAGQAFVKFSDEDLLGHIVRGDASAFWDTVQAINDANNICGLAPIYVMLKALGASTGQVHGYDQCPADGDNTSWVSIAGVSLS